MEWEFAWLLYDRYRRLLKGSDAISEVSDHEISTLPVGLFDGNDDQSIGRIGGTKRPSRERLKQINADFANESDEPPSVDEWRANRKVTLKKKDGTTVNPGSDSSSSGSEVVLSGSRFH